MRMEFKSEHMTLKNVTMWLHITDNYIYIYIATSLMSVHFVYSNFKGNVKDIHLAKNEAVKWMWNLQNLHYNMDYNEHNNISNNLNYYCLINIITVLILHLYLYLC